MKLFEIDVSIAWHPRKQFTWRLRRHGLRIYLHKPRVRYKIPRVGMEKYWKDEGCP